MIVNTVIDPAAIREAVASSHDGGKEVLMRLAVEMYRHGAITLAAGSGETALEQALDPEDTNLKPAVAKLWLKLLNDLRIWHRLIAHDVAQAGSNSDVFSSLQSIERLEPSVDLAIVRRQFAPDIGVEQGRRVCFASPEQVDRSPVISDLRKMKYTENYDRNTDSNRIWKERFAPCVRISETVTLVDQYLFGGKDGINEHLVPWVLERLNLAEVPSTLRVELIGAIPINTHVDDILVMLAENEFCKSTRLLSVWVVPEWKVEVRNRHATWAVQGPHNRHIRFSCSTAFTVEEGFDRFVNRREGKPKVWGTSGVTPHYVGGDDPLLRRLTRIEDDLKNATPAHHHFEL